MSGAALYSSLRCVNCHGIDGRGSSTLGVPTLVGRTADDLRSALIDPCSEGAICHPMKMPDLTQDQLTNLAAYLLELAGGSAIEDPGPPCTETSGQICTVAGTGVAGNKKAPLLMAREAYLFWPQNVTMDRFGRLIITDWNNFLLRRIEKRGCTESDCPITTIFGDGTLADECSTASQPAMARNIGNNHNITVEFDRWGNMLMAGWHMWKIKYIEVDANLDPQRVFCLFGNVRGFAGDGQPAGWNLDGMDGPVRFNLPAAAVMDGDGNFYIADQANVRIRKVPVDADDLFTTDAEAFVRSRQNNVIDTWIGGPLEEGGYARRTQPDYSDSGDGGPISEATLAVDIGFDATPQFRLALDDARKLLYIADSNNDRIRVVDLAVDPPTIDTFAGGGDDIRADGVPATEAKLHRPADVDLVPDGSGDVLITDTFNHCIRLVRFASRRIETLAGQCGEEYAGYEGDGGPALQAKLYEPGGAYLSREHVLYIADTINHRIRRVNP